jgi:hypothetical protein
MCKSSLVTQAELEVVLANYKALGETILSIRRRLEAGATVEQGIYAADSDRGDPISAYDQPLNGFGLYGLDVEIKGLPSSVHTEEAPIPASEQAPGSPEWWRAGTPLAIE